MKIKETFENGRRIYYESSNGYWFKSTYENGLQTKYEDSNGYWHKITYEDGLEVLYENSDGYWRKTDDKGIHTSGNLKDIEGAKSMRCLSKTRQDIINSTTDEGYPGCPEPMIWTSWYRGLPDPGKIVLAKIWVAGYGEIEDQIEWCEIPEGFMAGKEGKRRVIK